MYNSTDPEEIAYGSVVTIRTRHYGGALLHSHPSLYPAGMVEQQQITCYSHKVLVWRLAHEEGLK